MDILQRVRQGLAECGDPFSIGESVCGNPVYCVHVGGPGRQIIVTGGIHARECYTALVVLEQAVRFSGGADGAYFIPLVNPDGALFFENGTDFGHPFLRRNAAAAKVWKANADGVDLNTNFDARWGSGKSNVRYPGASDYIGETPLCAPESRALAEFTVRVKPAMTVSYHCAGGELYWEFFQTGERRARDERLAAAAAKHIGVRKVDGDLGSAGGYKDFCISALKIPALTVELISSGEHPFPPGAYADDIEKNADIVGYLLGMI